MNRSIIVAAAAVVVLAASAQADTLTVNGMASGLYSSVTIKYNGQSMNVAAGPQKVKLNGGTSFNAFCIDLDHWNTSGSSYGVNVVGLGTVNNSTMVKNLFENFVSDVTNSVNGAAFQIALWDAVVDGGDGLSSGSFRTSNLSSTIAAKVATYATGYNTQANNPMLFRVFDPTSHGYNGDKNQGLISAEAVPEPATMALLAVAAGSFIRRKRKA